MRRRLFGFATALTLLAVIGIVVLNGPAQAAPGDAGTNFYAYLNGGSEVPPTASNTTGMATFHVNGDGTMSYTLNVYNILNPFMGHIHLGAPGVAGPVVVDLIPMGAPNSGPQNIIASGTISAASFSGPLKGQPLSVLVNQMAYNAYVNIHTSNGTMTPGIGNYPGGEIRGDIISADANRIGTQPAAPKSAVVATSVVAFPFPPTYAPPAAAPAVAPVTGAVPAVPATGSQPLNPINAPGVSASSVGANTNAAGGQAASNPANAGGSTSGAASGAPTTGGSGSSNSNPTGGSGGSSGTGAAGGPLGAGTTITSGGTTGATSGSTTSSTSGSGTGGAGTVGNTSSGTTPRP